jgi:hypothetical protein
VWNENECRTVLSDSDLYKEADKEEKEEKEE